MSNWIVSTILCNLVVAVLSKEVVNHHDQAVEMNANGDIAGAMNSFKAAIRISPADPHSWYNLAVFLDDTEVEKLSIAGNPKHDALAAATRALALAPQDGDIMNLYNDLDSAHGGVAKDEHASNTLLRTIAVPSTPKILWYTARNLSMLPAKVHGQHQRFAHGYSLRGFDDERCRQYLLNHYGLGALNRFNELRGAHRADLWRYAVLLREGGVYLDVKTELVENLSKSFPDRSKSYTVLSAQRRFGVYQGIISTPPGSPEIQKMFQHALTTPISSDKRTHQTPYPSAYFVFTRFAETALRSGLNVSKLRAGDIPRRHYGLQDVEHRGNLNNTWHLFQESCDEFKEPHVVTSCTAKEKDRYGMCCSIWAFNDQGDRVRRVFRTRFKDYQGGDKIW